MQALRLESLLFNNSQASALQHLGKEADGFLDCLASLRQEVGMVGDGFQAFDDRTGTLAREDTQARIHQQRDSRQPVWEDRDDLAVEVSISSRNRLRKLRQEEGETALSGEFRKKTDCSGAYCLHM